jgi:4-amino-4-deoxy-L-arabinose transferase-like glycosyltransferase
MTSPAPSKQTPRSLALVLAFAALTRVAYLLAYSSFDPFYAVPIVDAARYDLWGKAIAAGETFEAGAFYQAPLYPYFIGTLYRVFGARPLAVYVAQMLAGLATLGLVHRTAERAYGPRAGLVASGLGALYGVFLFNETKLLPVTMTILFATLAVDRLQAAATSDYAKHWAIAGFAFGLAALASAGMLLLLAAAGAWITLDRSLTLAADACCRFWPPPS